MKGLRRSTESRYSGLVKDLSGLLESARRASARAVNTVMTVTYWEIGRRIVEFEQGGEKRAQYGAELLERLSADLTRRFGRGFSRPNLQRFRDFYRASRSRRFARHRRAFRPRRNRPDSFDAVERIFRRRAALGPREGRDPRPRWRLPPAVVALRRLLSARNVDGRAQLLRGRGPARRLVGAPARPPDRLAVLRAHRPLAGTRPPCSPRAREPKPGDAVTPEEEIKDPLVLEFLGLKDEYSETDLEEALIHHLESFLLELGGDFAFVGRQRRLRIGDEWYRVDLLFFHRRLRCLVVIDLKLGKFTHADAGQMHLYLNYAREHWTQPGENPPVGLILCAEKDDAVARYALEGLPNKVLARSTGSRCPTRSASLPRSRRPASGSRRVASARGHGQPLGDRVSDEEGADGGATRRGREASQRGRMCARRLRRVHRRIPASPGCLPPASTSGESVVGGAAVR